MKNEKELLNILSNWNIGRAKKINLSKKGVVNYNWFVETNKGKFFLRKFQGEHSLNDLKFEINYLKALHSNNFNYKTPNPILNKKNEYLIKNNGKYFWLDNFIEGKTKNIFGKTELKEIAKMLSQYHNILEKLNLKCNKKDNYDFSKKEVLCGINKFRNKINKKPKLKLNTVEKIYLNESEKLIPILENVNVEEYSKLKKYAIHRDLGPGNIHWIKNKISGILDFENVSQGNDSLVKDITIILQYSCSNKDHRLNFAKAKFFLSEYKKYRNILKKEIKLIPDIMAAGYIEDFDYQFWLWENDRKRANPKNLKIYSEAAQELWENKEEIVGELL